MSQPPTSQAESGRTEPSTSRAEADRASAKHRRAVTTAAALLISEIFPLAVRGRASSVATMANWLANFVVAVSYLSIIAAIGETATFAIYAAITVLSLVYVVKAVPETKNRTLSDIERELAPAH